MDLSSCYQILGVAPTTSDKELRTAYKRLAKVFHPDKQPAIQVNYYGMNFVKVQQAY